MTDTPDSLEKQFAEFLHNETVNTVAEGAKTLTRDQLEAMYISIFAIAHRLYIALLETSTTHQRYRHEAEKLVVDQQKQQDKYRQALINIAEVLENLGKD